jgi:hypothetical protein
MINEVNISLDLEELMDTAIASESRWKVCPPTYLPTADKIFGNKLSTAMGKLSIHYFCMFIPSPRLRFNKGTIRLTSRSGILWDISIRVL